MNKVENLNKKRAEKEEDCRLWTSLDMLKDLISDIESGETSAHQIVVHWFEDKREDGSRKHHYAAAGVTIPDHIALLNVGLKRVLDDWSE